ncbi:hypothetical protein FOA43_002152 [Brettanomyces nanus]|uniref:Uncharacterized protein n=1 Tax=Eeniella nana TaxID=13502 RepID=A0A875S077_EENNA|nr:uncharacterized protein FOA43_002152 [Brettanomyces nanus]QPG74816.1 hypothetical protein FOA43_002152 [Brettanomyces nanus]
MKVVIRINNQHNFHVTVPDNATVEDLKIASLVALPPKSGLNSHTAKLWYSGKKLEFSTLLSSYGITAVSDSTVYLTDDSQVESNCAITDNDVADLTIVQQHIKKTRSKSKSKNRCSFGTCHASALRLTGECQFCKGKFCSKHRLLEKHNCKGLKICKNKCFERNALKLRNEQTVTSKV